jgi:hypothetical protein
MNPTSESIDLVALVLLLVTSVVVAGWAWHRVQQQRRTYRKYLERAMR